MIYPVYYYNYDGYDNIPDKDYRGPGWYYWGVDTTLHGPYHTEDDAKISSKAYFDAFPAEEIDSKKAKGLIKLIPRILINGVFIFSLWPLKWWNFITAFTACCVLEYLAKKEGEDSCLPD